jgi:hypothetical protein
MARTQEEIEEDLRAVRCAMREMLSTKEGSVGLRNVLQIAERTEQGMRPTYAQLAAREKELVAELALIKGQGMTIRTRYEKGIMR